MKKWGLYEWSIIEFFIIFPLLTLIAEYVLFEKDMNISLILKWITFYYVGCRLFAAGIKQFINDCSHLIFQIETL